MPFIAIVGAGALGGALAHRLAARDRIRELRLIDARQELAQGKALDIQQSGAVEGFGTRLTGMSDIEAAAGARAIVIADPGGGDGSFAGEAGLALVRKIVRVDGHAPLVFAAADVAELMQRAVTELRVPAGRLVGSAPGALQAAVRALTGLALDGTGADVQMLVVGLPPRAVVLWEGASASGEAVSSRLPAHQIQGISALVPRLWPPGPQALASAAARVTEGIVAGGRRRMTCFVPLDSAPGRGRVAAVPVELDARGVRRVHLPAFSTQERTLFENSLSDPAGLPRTAAG